jgi:hypothetical protein
MDKWIAKKNFTKIKIKKEKKKIKKIWNFQSIPERTSRRTSYPPTKTSRQIKNNHKKKHLELQHQIHYPYKKKI